MKKRSNAEYDQIMQQIHEVVTQQAIMRRMLEECLDQDFLVFLMNKMVFFRQGQIAKEFWEQTKKEYDLSKNLHA